MLVISRIHPFLAPNTELNQQMSQALAYFSLPTCTSFPFSSSSLSPLPYGTKSKQKFKSIIFTVCEAATHGSYNLFAAIRQMFLGRFGQFGCLVGGQESDEINEAESLGSRDGSDQLLGKAR